MLVEAAFATSQAPGPLRAFYRRIEDRRGFQVATVAVARKLVVLCWHPVHRRRGLRMRAAEPQRPQAAPTRARRRRHVAPRTGRPALAGYHINQLRDAEKELVEHADEVAVAHWQPQKPASQG